MKKMIIFDDDKDILSVCSYILEEEGWEVHTFPDCIDIIERVSRIAPEVILMDNWIPDIGGILATQKLKNEKQLRAIPVIYFSANSDIASLAKQAGANSYIAKPFDLDDLSRIVAATVAA